MFEGRSICIVGIIQNCKKRKREEIREGEREREKKDGRKVRREGETKI